MSGIIYLRIIEKYKFNYNLLNYKYIYIHILKVEQTYDSKNYFVHLLSDIIFQVLIYD